MKQTGAGIIIIALLSVPSAFADIVPTLPTTPTSGTSGSSADLLQYMQTQTTQALQIFNNVNYQKISGNQDQQYFFNSDDTQPQHFNIPGVQS